MNPVFASGGTTYVSSGFVLQVPYLQRNNQDIVQESTKIHYYLFDI